MDIIIITIISLVVGIIAGIIQVVQYFQQQREKKRALSQAIVRPKLAITSIPDNLPRRTELIGRESEISSLHEALCSPSFLIMVDGLGGIGKTSIALEVAHECLRASKEKLPSEQIAKFDGFIWTSAQDRELTLNSLLDTIARVLEQAFIIQKPLEEKQFAVETWLKERPHLLVVDNFETITDNSIKTFLRNLPAPSKALITTRVKNLSGAKVISVKGMPESESLTLIRAEGKRLGLAQLASGDDSNLKPFFQATGGAPLAIKWAIGQIKQKGQSLDTILLSLHTARGDIFDFVLERSWELCTESARQVLRVIPLFATPVSRAALETVSDLHHLVLDEAIGQLVEMSLIDTSDVLDSTKRRYSIHPLTRAFAFRKLIEIEDMRKQAVNYLAEYYKVFTDPFLYWYKPYPESAELELEILNVYQTIRLCLDAGFYQQAYEIFYNVCNFVFRRGYWNDALEISFLIISRISESEAEEKEIIVAQLKNWPVSHIYRHRGDLNASEKYSKEALIVFSKVGNKEREASSIRNLGRVAHERKKYRVAENYLKKSLGYYENGNFPWEQMLVILNLAELALQKEDLDKAWELSERALTIAEKISDSEHCALSLAIKGGVQMRRGNLPQAEELLQMSLDIGREIDRHDAIADTLTELGHVKLGLGDSAAAASAFMQALEIYHQMSMQRKIDEVEKMLRDLKTTKVEK